MNKPNFSTTWIFSAIYIGGEHEASLSALIGCADCLNHAIPTLHEIVSSLSYLESHNLVEVVNEKICVTSFGSELYESARKRKGGLFSVPENVMHVFNENLNYELQISKREYKFINESSLNIAYQEYRKKLGGS